MKAFSIDYYILVTVSAVGVFQLVAMRGGLRGLLLLRPSRLSTIVWAAFPLAAVVWFFVTKDRKLSDHMGGLSSNEIALAFFVGVGTAWVLTVAAASILNHNRGHEEVDPRAGLESLSSATYFRAVLHNVRYWYREWRR
jgi:hypothetical protein